MKKILVIDDEDDFQHIVGQVLRDKNYSVTYAGDGVEGLEKIETEIPNLILLDINLPRMSGIEVLKRIRGHGSIIVKNLPVVMLTVRKKDEDQIKGLDNGADDYITKPFKPEELLSRINAVLKRGQKTKNL
ncbi:MAG: Alkaline phosphatase synthesis transcriptional regulatory protein PhoP [Elusimicrobia bacterium ADurb.Bin231]|nr:MAG: Alkaline phosphatase synthesis transcriptional regulatory protein PhoP [Elusimicrobia bacterium ADurb.Bin231]